VDNYNHYNDYLIRAKVTVTKSGITPVTAPWMSFEQLRLLVKP
jgi:hypothetical protein